MTTLRVLENWLSPAVVRAMGYALLHSLWQGAALAGLLAAALPLLRRSRPEVRYAASVAALAGLLLAVAGTAGYYYLHAPAPAERVLVGMDPRYQVVLARMAAFQPGRPAPATSLLSALARTCEPYLPVLVAAWLLGLLLMGSRLAGGLLVAGRLRRVGVQAVGAEWQQRLALLAARAGLRRPVALLESGRVRGPLVLGYLRPAILLPLGAVAGLPPALLEALLAHELAHVLRRDYLLNLVLAAVEVLFFYHPAVWFMAGCLRAERENCCDDQAAALCGGDRLRVARALAALAELEAVAPATPRLALAASGGAGRGSLLARVRRLAVGRPQAPTLGEGLLAAGLCLLGVAGLGTSLAVAAPLNRPVAQRPGARAASPADTTRRTTRHSVTTTVTGLPGGPAVAATVTDSGRALAGGDSLHRLKKQVEMRIVRDEDADEDAPPLPRRRASTIVLQKDKKGRVLSLTVDGQPVPTGEPGKKKRRDKPAATTEIIEAPALAAPQWRHFKTLVPEGDVVRIVPGQAFHDEALQKARRGLAKSLQNPDLTAEQRRAIEQAQHDLEKSSGQFPSRTFTYRLGNVGGGQLHELRSLNALRPGTFNIEPDVRIRLSDDGQRQAERQLRQAEQQLRRAQVELSRSQLNGQLSQQLGQLKLRQLDGLTLNNKAVRRAELEARIAAAEAELRALDAEADSPQPLMQGGEQDPQPPRPPRAPRAPRQTAPPPPPPPPAPNSAMVRSELRHDGLIGKTDRNFSLELDNQGGRVNGRALTPAQVAKYRSLLGQPASGKGKSVYRMESNEK